MISVADLQPGDVVEMSWPSQGGQITVAGPLRTGDGRALLVAGYVVRERDGSPIQALTAGKRTLTVVSRAKPPLYVNSTKTRPDPGDVVRTEESASSYYTWRWIAERWCDQYGQTWSAGMQGFPGRLRLLVDGDTGQVVP